MELGVIILILFHVLNCLYCYYYDVCLPHIMVFVYIFIVYISFECVYIYNFWEFCFINLKIVNYFVSFSSYAPTVRCYISIYIYMVLTFYKNLSYNPITFYVRQHL